MIRRTNPTERLSHFARKSSFFSSFHSDCVWFRFETLDLRGVRSFGAKVAKNLMSLLIKFDQTPTWHLPCRPPAGRAPVFILFTVFICCFGFFPDGKKKSIFGSKLDAVLSERIKGVRMRGRCSKEGSLKAKQG